MQAGDVRQIKAAIEQGFARLLLLVSTVAVRGDGGRVARRDQHDHGQHPQPALAIRRPAQHRRHPQRLLRLVLAEALLLGIIGIGLGLVAGLQMSIDAHELSRIVLGYAPPPTEVPWGIIMIGTVLVLLIAWSRASCRRSPSHAQNRWNCCTGGSGVDVV